VVGARGSDRAEGGVDPAPGLDAAREIEGAGLERVGVAASEVEQLAEVPGGRGPGGDEVVGKAAAKRHRCKVERTTASATDRDNAAAYRGASAADDRQRSGGRRGESAVFRGELHGGPRGHRCKRAGVAEPCQGGQRGG